MRDMLESESNKREQLEVKKEALMRKIDIAARDLNEYRESQN